MAELTDIVSSLSISAGVWYVVYGIIISVAISVTGIGGAVTLVPFLVLMTGDIMLAVGTSSLCSALIRLTAVSNYVITKNVSYRVFLVFILGALPGLWLSDYLIDLSIADNWQDVYDQLARYLIATVIIVSAVVMIKKTLAKTFPKAKVLPKALSKGKSQPRRQSKPSDLAIGGSLVGFMVGSTGVGGGVAVIPLLDHFSGLSLKKVVGTAILISSVLSAITAFLYGQRGSISYEISIYIMIGSLSVTPFNYYLVKVIPELALRWLIIIMIIISAVMILSA